jgi:hypothetical protein
MYVVMYICVNGYEFVLKIFYIEKYSRVNENLLMIFLEFSGIIYKKCVSDLY